MTGQNFAVPPWRGSAVRVPEALGDRRRRDQIVTLLLVLLEQVEGFLTPYNGCA